MQLEVIENRPAARVGERHSLEVDASALRHQFDGVRAVGHAVRFQQCAHRFGETRDVLRDVDEGDGEVTRAVQDGEAERADQHDVAGRSPAVVPQPQRPAEQAGRQHGRDDRVQETQLLQIKQALLARIHFGFDGRAEARLLANRHTERAHKPMLLITSTSSPSTEAALVAKW
jgi:hypothetical protein